MSKEKGKIKYLLFTLLLTFGVISLLPSLFSTVLINMGTVSCNKDLIAVGGFNYLVVESKQLPSSTCKQALEYFLLAQGISSEATDTKVLIGRAELAQGDYKNAIKAFESSLSSNPQDDNNLLFSGLAYSKDGQINTAFSRWSNISASGYVLTFIGNRIATSTGCLQALPYYKFATEKPNVPGIQMAHLAMAECFYSQKKYQKAVIEYKLSLANGLADATIANKLGKLLVTLNQPDAAIPYLEQAIRWHNYAYYMIDLAKTYDQKGDQVQAEHWYKEAERVAPNSYDVYYLHGNYFFEHKKYSEAIQSYEQAVKIEPYCPSFCYFNLGRAYFEYGLIDNALQNFQKALKDNPDDVNIENWVKKLSYCLNINTCRILLLTNEAKRLLKLQ